MKKRFLLGIQVITMILGISIVGCGISNGAEKNDDPADKPGKNESKVDKIFKYLETEDFILPEGFDKRIGEVSYGAIAEKTYFSATTGANRKCNVYTPPNFDPSKTYPVLYLLHGIGGTHSEWTGGAPNEIISNLIAIEKAPAMIVVIPNVRAMANDSVPSNPYSAEAVVAFNNFINDLRDDLMPFIEENYRVSNKREDRAIAGLSMGGMETLFIGVSIPEVFGHIGAFSSAPGLFNRTQPFSEANMTLPFEYRDDTFIMVCCGKQDNLISNSVNYNAAFVNNKIRTFYYEVDGGHDFGFWKHGLYYFIKCIFWQPS